MRLGEMLRHPELLWSSLAVCRKRCWKS